MVDLTLLACAVLWSSYDGVLAWVSSHGRAIWLVEGVLLYVGAIAAANLFRFAFGQASVGW